MKILLITDLYPIKECEKNTPHTLLDFVKNWELLGNEVTVLRPNFLLNSFLRGKPFYKQGIYGNIINLNYWLPFLKAHPLSQECPREFCDKEREQNSRVASEKVSDCTARGGGAESRDTRLEYDLIISHMPCGNIYADRLGKPFFVGVHISDLKVLTQPLYKIYFKNRLLDSLRHSQAIVCRSEMIKKKLLAIYPEFEKKAITAPSGIAERLIVQRQPLKDKNNIKVLTCANLIKRKNVDKLIDAVNGLKGFTLTVIGDGKEFKKLKRMSKDVIFTGRLSPENVHEYMKQSDIFVLPSIDETFGMVYLEALAAGCITVCTKNDGVDGIIQDGENGFTTLPNPLEIRKTLLKIKDLNEDNIKKISDNTNLTAKKYTAENCSKNYLQQIDKFL